MLNLSDIKRSSDPRRIPFDGRVLTAHQAEFMPWLGFISKITMGDIHLILDDTQYKKRYFENRNKIRFYNNDGWLWLNIPIKNDKYLPNMLDVEVIDKKWVHKHLSSIKFSYSNAPFFQEIYPEIEALYKTCQSKIKLVDINIMFIKYALSAFKIATPIFTVSEIKNNGVKIDGSSTDLVISLCKAVDAQILVAGISGKDYLDQTKMKNANIKVVFQNFTHPIYDQIHGSFMPYMSFIDILFNHGKEGAIKIIGVSSYDTE